MRSLGFRTGRHPISCRMFRSARLKKKAISCGKQHRRRMESQGTITEILSPKLSKGADFNQTTFLPPARTEQKKYDQPGFEIGVMVSGQLQKYISRVDLLT